MKLTISQLRRIIKEEVQNVVGGVAAPGERRVTFSHPDLRRLGTMTGVVRTTDWDGEMFYPDQKHHADLVKYYGTEPEGGLYLDGANVNDV